MDRLNILIMDSRYAMSHISREPFELGDDDGGSLSLSDELFSDKQLIWVLFLFS